MNQAEAARAVLLEVMNVLGAFRDEIVIVGGWVPDLKYPGKRHMGSLDVDLAVAPGAARQNAYSTILARLAEHQYSHSADPTRYYRNVAGAADPVKVDIISGEYVMGPKTQSVQVNELALSSLRGIDLAFEHCEEIQIEGTMPDGSHNVVRARIVRPEAFILIKAFAFADRMNDKDVYDIAFVLHNYEPSLDALAAELRPIVANGLGAEAYGILTEKFAQIGSVGPKGAAAVAVQNGDDSDQAQQAAFQDAQTLFAEVQSRQL